MQSNIHPHQMIVCHALLLDWLSGVGGEWPTSSCIVRASKCGRPAAGTMSALLHSQSCIDTVLHASASAAVLTCVKCPVASEN